MHGVYGFITRDEQTYGPRLSSSEAIEPTRHVTVGRYQIPVSKGRVRMLRKGVPFWHSLARAGFEATILRVPVTFPPEPFKGRLLAGMCVPDLLGTQGTYTCYGTTDRRVAQTGGRFVPLSFVGDRARSQVLGPRHPWLRGKEHLTIPFEVTRPRDRTALRLRVGEERFTLRPGEISPWVRLRFRAGSRRLHGLARFHLLACDPDVTVYMSPIHIDPERPVMPISHPGFFSDYLAKCGGPFGTLGLMEDTSALNDGVLDETAFLKQVWQFYEERRSMFLGLLDGRSDDLAVCVFDTPDRIQHMFWHHASKGPPATRNGKSRENGAIADMYVAMDRLLGDVRARLDRDDVFLTISDHGFTSFRRGVNLNAWLLRNGYLRLKPGAVAGRDWLEGVDWSATRAYALGLAGVFVNREGREAQGIVEPGAEFDGLLVELGERVTAFRDLDGPAPRGHARRPIRRVAATRDRFGGPFRFGGPDLIVGYDSGYRCSWEGARGQVTEQVLTHNTRPWSGDHCVAPELVPGVLCSNSPLKAHRASIVDIAPTVLEIFGVQPEAPMQGTSLLA
jgi:predicted AlkP superfamily phosphohydrolase/phosphomutase